MQITGKRKRGPASSGRIAPKKFMRLDKTLSIKSAREKNVIDVAHSSAVSAGSSAITLLNGSVPGSGVSDRLGRRINMVSLQLRLGFTNEYAATVGGTTLTGQACDYFRVILVYDKQTNGSTPAVTDVLVSDNVNSLTNLNNRDRFTILMDKLINPSAYADPSPETHGNGYVFSSSHDGRKWFRKLDLLTQYNAGTAGTAADIATGALWLIKMSSGSTGGNITYAGLVSGNSRLRFYTD